MLAVSDMGPRGSTRIFSYIRRLGSFFFWLKILNFDIFRGFSEKIFCGMKILWISFGVITQLDYIKWSFLCILGSFLKVKVQIGAFFGVAKFQIFLGCLKFLNFFLV